MNTMSVMRMLGTMGGGGPPGGMTPIMSPMSQRYQGYVSAQQYGPPPTAPPPEEESRRSREPTRSKKQSRRREPSPKSESDSESDSGSSSSSFSDYEEPEIVKRKMKAEPCAHISPAGLNDKKTKREVYGYLKEKECPKLETFKKSKPAPTPKSEPKPKAKAEKPEKVEKPAKAEKPEKAAPKKAAPEKPKPESTYVEKYPPPTFQMLIRKYRAEGKNFVEAVAAAKIENDENKKKQ